MSTDFEKYIHGEDWGDMIIECDRCGEYANFEGSFIECIAQAKEEGWIVFLADDDTWTHICSSECHAALTFD